VKKSKFSEEQIVRILKEVEAGAKVAETCRKHKISEPTYYIYGLLPKSKAWSSMNLSGRMRTSIRHHLQVRRVPVTSPRFFVVS
jgi:hypothetical protein